MLRNEELSGSFFSILQFSFFIFHSLPRSIVATAPTLQSSQRRHVDVSCQPDAQLSPSSLQECPLEYPVSVVCSLDRPDTHLRNGCSQCTLPLHATASAKD